jgi:pyridoxal phosphate enzyme (YggS family)
MIKDNISKVKQRIVLACSKINQDPGRITLIAVTKGRSVGKIEESINSGITDIGENKVQEAIAKYDKLSAMGYRLSAIKWHMVGHLQTNKVKESVRIFDLIQSVDSLRLAQEINKQAAKINKIQDILIEVKTSSEESKFGLKPDEAFRVAGDIATFSNINIKGLMTIAPLLGDPGETRQYFKILRELRDKINKSAILNHELQILSMGMTDDFEVAVEEGANMVRIGRAIFEG